MELLDEKIHLWIDSAIFVKAKPSIYVLYDKKLDPLYIGASENLQEQFSIYLDMNFEDNTCKQKTHTYQRMFVTDPTERKKILLEKFKVTHGRLPRCNSEID